MSNTPDRAPLVRAIAQVVREHVAKAFRQLTEKFEALEQRVADALASIPPPQKGEKGDPGGPGDRGDPGPKGDKGDPGERGSSVTAADVLPALRDELRQAIAAIPAPKDGTSVTVDDVLPVLERMVETRVATWALEFERRAADTLQRAVDRLPAPAAGKDGRDGVDGLGFDDLTVDYDGERAVTLRFARGEQVREHNLILPVVLDRGVFKDGTAYVPGDGVTWAGSYWIAQRSTSAKPETSDDWRLAVRKGRDGKNGERGRDFRAEPVKAGP